MDTFVPLCWARYDTTSSMYYDTFTLYCRTLLCHFNTSISRIYSGKRRDRLDPSMTFWIYPLLEVPNLDSHCPLEEIYSHSHTSVECYSQLTGGRLGWERHIPLDTSPNAPFPIVPSSDISWWLINLAPPVMGRSRTS